MRNWEDILKEKLEGYESLLPEESLAEFRARRDQAAPAAKRYSPRWGWALAGAAVAAAGLAALLLPPRPAVPEDAVQIVQDQPVAEAVKPETVNIDETVPAPTPLIRPVTRKSTRNAPVALQETETEVEPAEPIRIEPSEEDVIEHIDDAVEENLEPAKEPVVQKATSPFVPQSAQPRKVQLNVAPVAGAVVGGGLLAAVLTPWARTGNPSPDIPKQANATTTANNLRPAINGFSNYGGMANGGSDPYSPSVFAYADQNALSNEAIPQEFGDVLGDYTHYRPLKTGLSARIPLTEKLSVTTGLTYSLYRSKLTFSLSGEQAQQVHYLGVPVRLDWTLASNRWLDVYLGAGMVGDLCVGATLAGSAFTKDGPSFALLGAGGLQWNILPRLGLYLEPELSWSVPSDNHVLKTYRQEHPLVFTVATGLRINLGKQ